MKVEELKSPEAQLESQISLGDELEELLPRLQEAFPHVAKAGDLDLSLLRRLVTGARRDLEGLSAEHPEVFH